jgi:hypothetical protein
MGADLRRDEDSYDHTVSRAASRSYRHSPEVPTLWKWQVFQGDLEVAHGLEASRESAQGAGDTALFKLLAELKP